MLRQNPAQHQTILISRSASPTAARFASFISEYLREITNPFCASTKTCLGALVDDWRTGTAELKVDVGDVDVESRPDLGICILYVFDRTVGFTIDVIRRKAGVWKFGVSALSQDS